MSTHKQSPQKGGPSTPTASRAVRPALIDMALKACRLLVECDKNRELFGRSGSAPGLYFPAVTAAKEALAEQETDND